MDNNKILPGLIKIFFGLIFKDSEKLELMKDKINDFAPIDLSSEIIPFDFTDYYRDEIGKNLKRQWVSVKKTIQENKLPGIKNTSINWEKELSTDGSRTVNCDPGGISLNRVVLVTTKNYSHRIYLGKQIFGEVTMIYRGEGFKKLPWTYPDYYSETFLDFAAQCREKFSQKLEL